VYEDALDEFAGLRRDDLGKLLLDAASAITALALAELAAHGHPLVHGSHIAVFSGLEPAGTNISTLADRAGVSRQAMAALVKEVEHLGYVTTRPDPDDRRAVRVELTADGARFCRDAAAVSRRITARWESTFGADRLELLRSQLRDLGSR
jgi:DNA-binding MarR family transcriptional regulator